MHNSMSSTYGSNKLMFWLFKFVSYYRIRCCLVRSMGCDHMCVLGSDDESEHPNGNSEVAFRGKVFSSPLFNLLTIHNAKVQKEKVE